MFDQTCPRPNPANQADIVESQAESFEKIDSLIDHQSRQLSYGPNWTPGAFAAGEDAGARFTISGGEVLELGTQEGSAIDIPF
jgi:hypothetical protein